MYIHTYLIYLKEIHRFSCGTFSFNYIFHLNYLNLLLKKKLKSIKMRTISHPKMRTISIQ